MLAPFGWMNHSRLRGAFFAPDSEGARTAPLPERAREEGARRFRGTTDEVRTVLYP